MGRTGRSGAPISKSARQGPQAGEDEDTVRLECHLSDLFIVPGFSYSSVLAAHACYFSRGDGQGGRGPMLALEVMPICDLFRHLPCLRCFSAL